MNDTVYGANTSARSTAKNIAVQTDESKPFSPKWDRHLLYQVLHISVDYVLSSSNIEQKIFMATIMAMMFGMFIYFRAQVSEKNGCRCGKKRAAGRVNILAWRAGND